jgi:hypothetical protein
MIKKWLRRHLA